MKILIFDSSSLITLSMNGLTYILEKLKKDFTGKLIITQDVKNETIDVPLKIKRFELGALKIKNLIDKKILEMSSSIGISNLTLKKKTSNILKKANTSFQVEGEFMHIIDKGEASCLALSLICKEKGIENLVVVDERTTRLLGENPKNLKKIFEKKIHKKVRIIGDFKEFKNIKFIRSSELVYVAYKKGFIELKGKNILDALLYATKFKGCAISREEIEEAKKFALS